MTPPATPVRQSLNRHPVRPSVHPSRSVPLRASPCPSRVHPCQSRVRPCPPVPVRPSAVRPYTVRCTCPSVYRLCQSIAVRLLSVFVRARPYPSDCCLCSSVYRPVPSVGPGWVRRDGAVGIDVTGPSWFYRSSSPSAVAGRWLGGGGGGGGRRSGSEWRTAEPPSYPARSTVPHQWGNNNKHCRYLRFGPFPSYNDIRNFSRISADSTSEHKLEASFTKNKSPAAIFFSRR